MISERVQETDRVGEAVHDFGDGVERVCEGFRAGPVILKRRTSMSHKSATAVQPAKEGAAVRVLPPSDLFERVQETYNAIARRAFEVFEGRGRADGHDLEDWLRAESELLHPLHLDVAETDQTVTVKAEVPGFSAKDLEVSLEPQRLTIIGRRDTKQELKAKKTIYSEHCSNQLFRSIDLPADVDSSKVTVTLKDGIMELVMPRFEKAKETPVEDTRS
jgi:HSP20 family protein